MDRKKLIIYAGIPAAIVSVLMAMYFSGIRILETIAVMPYLEGVPPNSQREFGLVEFVEHSIIVAALVVAVRAAVRMRGVLRALFMTVSAGILFLFLEEIDYGLHYYEYLAGIPPEESAQARNLHNVGDRTSQMKRVADVGMAVVFIAALLPLERAKSPWLRFFAPERYLALTLVVAVLTRTVAHALDDRGLGVGISSNISEFREIVTFYFGLLYTMTLSRRAREAPPIVTAAQTRPPIPTAP